jgi:UDP-N-acetylglucosamine 2-epimerase (non-hydrolysing)
VMIDTMLAARERAMQSKILDELGLDKYGLVTLHRPSNVDDPARLRGIVDGLCSLAEQAPVIFPVHPRTRARLADDAQLDRLEAAGVRCTEPVGYLDFLSLQAGAGTIVTDSGGVQEEASALGVPCFTLRANTERPITISHGTNVLLGDDPAHLREVRLSRRPPTPCAIPLWDGHAAERAADAVLTAFPDVAQVPEAVSA